MAKIRRRKSRPLRFSDNDPKIIKTFHVKYDKELSPVAKLVLNNLQNKYLYYAIEDILSLLKARPMERDILLAILYSPVLSLQNHFSISFFNIWIKDIYTGKAKDKLDIENPDESKRGDSLQGKVILHGFKYDDDEWNKGKIYDPKNGKTYKSYMRLKNKNMLKMAISKQVGKI